MNHSLPWPLTVYRLGTSALTPFIGGLLAWRMRKGKEDRTRGGERRGYPGRERPPGRLAWMHGASVGETISLLPIVERLTRQGFTVLVTSGTVTSARMLAERLPTRALHQFVPLDVMRFMRRFLDHWQPDLVLIAESEIWPNALAEIRRREIPALLLNARMSERSFRRWQRVPKTASGVLRLFDLCLAQSEADGERLERLGAPRVVVAGNIKYDAPAPPANPATVATLSAMIGERPVWLAASTHSGEEDLVLRAHRMLMREHPGLLTIIVPRHPERGPEIAGIASAAGLASSLRSLGDLPSRGDDVHIGDTIGELGLFYRLAPLAFIGGSLVPRGGQNPIEPAKLGATIIHGPHVHNFTNVYQALDTPNGDGISGACPVSDSRTLAGAVHALFEEPAHARAMARAAAQTTVSLGGAVDRTMQAITPYVMHMHLSGG
ncbi:3-deoxy-D-manno-octulosonic acid transferase [Pseudochelatococcus contaminans]|uniref:3-deoxy-D-manno-octulosonic acid transferase n=1 Tax=Pseudochelatococcus contaminans TaxID=1538103 RepID=A0A7W5Z1B3_9HYPH|nr:3-deoxy-D-manno-octulosonic acid transferase [Pseudochelatococcus contaminans]MBB3808223.1 3-deoxy-D-manno-octulosonic-acid transferase [Pseudochelatococcus contaminans]